MINSALAAQLELERQERERQKMDYARAMGVMPHEVGGTWGVDPETGLQSASGVLINRIGQKGQVVTNLLGKNNVQHAAPAAASTPKPVNKYGALLAMIPGLFGPGSLF